MKILGLCGGSGAGKTTALEIFAEYGAVICDCDKVSRDVMKKDTPCYRDVVSFFGGEILRDDGEIDRAKLGKIVFSDGAKREKLTEITHFYIKEEIFSSLRRAEAEGAGLFVIDAPLLFESELDRICHITLAIVAPAEDRIRRIIERDKLDRALAEKRLSSQISDGELQKRAGYTVENDGTKKEFEKKIREFIESRGLAK